MCELFGYQRTRRKKSPLSPSLLPQVQEDSGLKFCCSVATVKSYIALLTERRLAPLPDTVNTLTARNSFFLEWSEGSESEGSQGLSRIAGSERVGTARSTGYSRRDCTHLVFSRPARWDSAAVRLPVSVFAVGKRLRRGPDRSELELRVNRKGNLTLLALGDIA